MINLWRKTGFDKILYEAWNSGKVICGISAGAICWFNFGNSDSEEELTCLDCLNWVDFYVTPHADEEGRVESSIQHLKDKKVVGILLSNCCALEIVDNNYKIIKSDKNAFAYIAFWKNNKFFKNEMAEYGVLDDLLR